MILISVIKCLATVNEENSTSSLLPQYRNIEDLISNLLVLHICSRRRKLV